MEDRPAENTCSKPAEGDQGPPQSSFSLRPTVGGFLVRKPIKLTCGNDCSANFNFIL